MGFIMVSKNVGQTIIDNVINQDGRLELWDLTKKNMLDPFVDIKP